MNQEKGFFQNWGFKIQKKSSKTQKLEQKMTLNFTGLVILTYTNIKKDWRSQSIAHLILQIFPSTIINATWILVSLVIVQQLLYFCRLLYFMAMSQHILEIIASRSFHLILRNHSTLTYQVSSHSTYWTMVGAIILLECIWSFIEILLAPWLEGIMFQPPLFQFSR